jgi:hypothetical protein
VKVGYIDGCGAFYVALEDDSGTIMKITDKITEKWSPVWKRRNDEVEEYLKADEHLKVFSNKMFHVWDGNLRFQCWMPSINKNHADNYY